MIGPRYTGRALPNGAAEEVGILDELQEAVASSLTKKQKQTTLDQQLRFLSTEVGEVLKESLNLDGLYGAPAQAAATGHLCEELCDVIWNAIRIGQHLNQDLSPFMRRMLHKNERRVWVERLEDADADVAEEGGAPTPAAQPPT